MKRVIAVTMTVTRLYDLDEYYSDDVEDTTIIKDFVDPARDDPLLHVDDPEASISVKAAIISNRGVTTLN